MPLVRITGLIGNRDRSKIKSEVIFDQLYEPTAISIYKGVIYVGEKDKISRLEDLNGDGAYQQNEKVVLIEGVSQPNFHTYTIGFEQLLQDGDVYLVGNFTTSILLGGKRDLNVTVNPKTHRGSTFVFGPITGKETAADVDIQYLAGGYRTPNSALDTSNGGSHQTDWRLPNVQELQSLIDYGRFNPALSNSDGTGQWTAGNPFTGVVSSSYWSSTTLADYTSSAWYVSLSFGRVYGTGKGNAYYVWPVRGGQ